MSSDQCPNCGLRPSSVAGYNHTAWCPNATLADWPEHVLKNGKRHRMRNKVSDFKDGDSK